MNWTPVIILLISMTVSGIIGWLFWLTVGLTEVDRTQEGVEKVNENQTKTIIENRAQILKMSDKVVDRFTGTEATMDRESHRREMDHLNEDLKDHKHEKE